MSFASGPGDAADQVLALNPQPLVSIVIPTYNRAHLVGQALDAILAQTYTNLQIIVVNDGSRDNTAEVLASYELTDKRFEIINKENEGIPDTVNRGWREARGEYVTWTSDDNLYYPEAIATMVEYLQSNPEIALVYSDCRYINGEGEVLFTRHCEGPEALYNDCPIMGCLLFRRTVFENAEMFRRQWKRVHDYDFYRRVWQQYKIGHIAQVLYDYRLHDESMTGDRYAMSTEHARLLDSVAESGAERRAAWGRCWHDVARQAQREGRNWAAVGYYLKAAIQEPKRVDAFWDSLWKTAYSSTPLPVKQLWRQIK